MHKLSENYDVRLGLAIQDIASATTTNGTGVDCKDTNDDCMAIMELGTQTGTHTCDVKIQESAVVDSGFADITGAVFTQTDDGDDDAIAAIGFKRTKRFIRAVAVTAGTVTANNIAVSFLLKALHGKAALNSATAA